jgi:hypothetical protein
MADVWLVTHKMRLLGQEIRNTFYYEEISGEPDGGEWVDIVDEIRADLVAELDNFFTEDWTFYGIDARKVSAADLPSTEYLPTLGDLVGESNTDAMATQIAMLISVQGLTAKPRRARTYMAGWPEAILVAGLFQSNYISAAETFIDLQSVLNAAGVNELQRVSAQWNSSHTIVTAYNNIAGRPSKASRVPATQRRRRIGVGI